MLGARGGELGALRWLRAVSTALGTLGLAALVLLQADRRLNYSDAGVPDRIAVNTIVTFELLLGVDLLARPPGRSPLIPVHKIAERLAS